MADDEIDKRNARMAANELRLTDAAFEKMKASAIQKWADSKPQEVEKREECYRLMHVIDLVRADLFEHIAAGQIAEAVPSKA